jgi:hypothetical protein
MATTIPTTEPAELRAGDTWKWRREDLVDSYPSPTWALKYRAKSAAGGFEFTAAADAGEFLVTVAASTTQTYVAGDYSWAAWVESGAEKYTVGSGVFRVLADLRGGLAADALDVRTHAAKVLASIEAVIEGRASKDQEEYTIAGRSLKRTPIADLMMLRARYRNEVESEAAGRRLLAGQSPGFVLQVRL